MKFIFVAILFFLPIIAYAGQDKAPDFTLKSNQGKNIRLADLKGQVVMLNFWATWCAPCRTEMPLLEELHQRYKPAGFTLLGVNVESDTTEPDKLVKDMGLTFPVLYDTKQKVSQLFKVGPMPSSIFIDCDGKLAARHEGYRAGDEKEHRKIVKGLMRSCK